LWTLACPCGYVCVRVDTCVSIVIELTENSDDVRTTQVSARVRTSPLHAEYEWSLTDFFLSYLVDICGWSLVN